MSSSLSVAASVPDDGFVERIWFGDSPAERLIRGALTPAAALYRAATVVRNALYDRGVLRARLAPIPALSVGNLSVGGTGKTPVAAWLATQLAERGARPAIVLRGYGGDEPLVHERLAPRARIVVARDRVEGMRIAADSGADCAVLDDAFQHRRAARVADVVLVSADRWTGSVRLLPAGPWREGLGALARATLLLVTRKMADLSRAESLAARLAPAGLPHAVAHLAPTGLASGQSVMPLSSLDGRAVLVVAGIGHPELFARQVEAFGARARTAFYPDHHAYTRVEVARLVERAAGGAWVVCTLKDHVKLAPLWPPDGPPLWYVSQHVALEAGQPALENLLAAVLRARQTETRARRNSGM
jgi:tetraacyldisaccharide 4'-kinase